MKTYIIYCDESIKKGEFFSNFYGGALINASDYDKIVSSLNSKKIELNLFGEIKWSKMSANYLEKYKEFIEVYFNFIKSGDIKVRIMFRQNRFRSTGLSEYHKENEFFILYYQFLKHAFGLQYCNADTLEPVKIIPYFDKLPDTIEKSEQFKEYICNIHFLAEKNISIDRNDIAEIDSHNHVILQGMDIILGAMQFRLNQEHLRKDPVTNRRGKKTIAKEKLYKHIYGQISDIMLGFNIGISTGCCGSSSALWEHPYRHWNFIPYEHVIESKNDE